MVTFRFKNGDIDQRFKGIYVRRMVYLILFSYTSFPQCKTPLGFQPRQIHLILPLFPPLGIRLELDFFFGSIVKY